MSLLKDGIIPGENDESGGVPTTEKATGNELFKIFEDSHFKIDMGLSKKEKKSFSGKVGRCIEQKDGGNISVKKDFNGIIFLEKDLGPKYQRTDIVGGKSYVREKIGGIADEYIGDQHLNSTALEQLGYKGKVCEDLDHFLKIRDNWIQRNNSNHTGFINRFFSKENKLHLPGYFIDGNFSGIGTDDRILLGSGFDVHVCKNYSDIHDLNPWERRGYSVLLLKSI